MSSPEDANDSEPITTLSKSRNGEKKKRVRACDMCRRRKVRCDGDRMPNSLCTNCKTYDYKCTYAPKKRAVDPEYILSLETQLAQAQETLQKLSARLDAADSQQTPNEQAPSRRSSPSSSSSTFAACQASQSPKIGQGRFPPLPPLDQQDIDPSEDELDAEYSIQRDLRILLDKHGHKQFIGKSSEVLLIQQALNMKEAANTANNLGMPSGIQLSNTCEEIGKVNPWIMMPTFNYSPQDFPEPDLLHSLIDLYFNHSNIYLPLLNRIIFLQELESGLHLRDESFGSAVLLVCAIGSRYSTDKRVLLDGLATDSWQSAGWVWFRRVQETRKMLVLQNARLYDLQVPSLAAIYFYGSPTPHAASANVAYGLRLAMDLGAHKRKVYKQTPNVEDELLKRAFWVMVILDRTLSTILGRPCCVQDEDYDLTYPIECDDEYWIHENPDLAFKQPPGKPSLIAAFISLIRLQQIQACTLRTVYATSKSKAIWGISDDCAPELVAVLDSSLNKWIDSLPTHLRWDPTMPDDRFMHQSAMLHSSYYHLQISVHRSFIPLPRGKPSNNGNMALPSLTICTNAARACIHTLEAQFKRSVWGGFQNLVPLFNAGIVLVLNTWATKQASTIPPSNTRDLEDIFKVICMLKALEPRIYIANRIVECMKEIAAIGNVPFPDEAANARRGTKRTREGEGVYPAADPTGAAASNVNIAGMEPRAMAGSQRVQQQQRAPPPMDSGSSPSSMSSASVPTPPSYMQQVGMDTGTSSNGVYLNQWVPPEEAYRLATSGMGTGGVTEPYGVHVANTSYVPPTSDYLLHISPQHQQHQQQHQLQHPRQGQQQAPYQESLFTSTPSSSGVPMDFNHPAHMPTNHISPDAWTSAPTTALSSSAQPQMDDPMAASYEPQYFDSDILAMLSSAPTSIEWGDWGTYLNTLNDVDNVRDISTGVSHL